MSEGAFKGNFKGVNLWLEGITLRSVDQASMDS